MTDGHLLQHPQPAAVWAVSLGEVWLGEACFEISAYQQSCMLQAALDINVELPAASGASSPPAHEVCPRLTEVPHLGTCMMCFAISSCIVGDMCIRLWSAEDRDQGGVDWKQQMQACEVCRSLLGKTDHLGSALSTLNAISLP